MKISENATITGYSEEGDNVTPDDRLHSRLAGRGLGEVAREVVERLDDADVKRRGFESKRKLAVELAKAAAGRIQDISHLTYDAVASLLDTLSPPKTNSSRNGGRLHALGSRISMMEDQNRDLI